MSLATNECDVCGGAFDARPTLAVAFMKHYADDALAGYDSDIYAWHDCCSHVCARKALRLATNKGREEITDAVERESGYVAAGIVESWSTAGGERTDAR